MMASIAKFYDKVLRMTHEKDEEHLLFATMVNIGGHVGIMNNDPYDFLRAVACLRSYIALQYAMGG